MSRILYSLRTTAYGFILAKFEDGVTFDHVATYTMDRSVTGDEMTCDCPSHKRPCKHVQMINEMIDNADTDQFYDPKDRSWHTPLAPTETDASGLEIETSAEELAEVLDEEDEANEFEIEPSPLSQDVLDGVIEAQAEVASITGLDTIPRPHPALGTIKRRI